MFHSVQLGIMNFPLGLFSSRQRSWIQLSSVFQSFCFFFLRFKRVTHWSEKSYSTEAEDGDWWVCIEQSKHKFYQRIFMKAVEGSVIFVNILQVSEVHSRLCSSRWYIINVVWWTPFTETTLLYYRSTWESVLKYMYLSNAK